MTDDFDARRRAGSAAFRTSYVRVMRELHGVSDAREWAEKQLRFYYEPTAPSGKAVISISISVQCLILACVTKAQVAAGGTMSEEVGRELAKRAQNDHDCGALVRHYMRRSIKEGFALPKALWEYADAVVGGEPLKRPKGERYWRIRTRNVFGGSVLLVLTEETHGFGLPAARNIATSERNSACDILAEVSSGQGWASVTYDMATSIWKDRERLWSELELIVAMNNVERERSEFTERLALRLLRLADLRGVA